MYTITKQFAFSVAHQIRTACVQIIPRSRLRHGHNYTVEVELCSTQLDATGFVVDYNDLAALRSYIDDTLD